MFNKKYKKGMADAAKAYEAFGKKQEDALKHILEEVRQGKRDLESVLRELNGNIDGLYDSDPRKNPQAQRIARVEEITPEIEALAGGAGSNRGTGGMTTKLKAAKIAKERGIPTAILSGSDLDCLYRLMKGESVGTVFPA